MGRPTDISPKAYLRSLLGYTPPFDRHDWLIDSNGKEVRYVIDFYTGDENSPTTSQSPRPKGERPHIAMHLDVRPALDTPQALFLRFKFSTMKFLQKYSSLFPFSTLFPKFGGSSSTDSSSKSSTEEKKK